MARVQVETVHDPARWEIFQGLLTHNGEAVGNSEYSLLTLTLRDDGGGIVGGLAGWIWLGWLSIDALWIAERYRGRRYGTALMEAAEAQARERGVGNVVLNTFSFQAPGFYEKLGYREFGRLENYPHGQHRSFLTKAL